MTKRTTTVISAVLLAMVMVSAAACSSASTSATGTTTRTVSPGFPVSLHAANGTVHIEDRPSAIVSMSPTATEMLYAIGAGDQVKAVNKDSDYPPGVPTTSLDPTNPNVEAIVAEHPDLVIVAGDPTDITSRLDSFGVPVLSLPAVSSLSGTYHQIQQLGMATGHESAAETEVSSLRSQVATIVAGTPKPTPAATYYYELDPTYYSVTSSTFIGSVLGLLGLKSVANAASTAADDGYPQLSAEFIVKANPDFIFLADTKCCGASPTSVAARPGWGQMTAVVKHQVVPLDDDIASRWGPRIVELMRTVSQALIVANNNASKAAS